LRVSTSTTASWKLAATSATGTASPAARAGLHPPRDGGLQPGEREVEAVPLHVAPLGQPAREVDDDLPVARRPVDVRSAGEGQPEHPGDLVEGLPRRVVDGRPEAAHVVR
jgi:hypothetical protein